MSIKIIKQKHPLQRNGSTRVERMLAALSPTHFELDDRSMQDLLVTAHRYAALLSWYDFDDRPDGDWTCFWETETLTYLAVLSAIDLEQLRHRYDAADYSLGIILESRGEVDLQQKQGAYRVLIAILVNMAADLDDRYLKLVAIRHPLQHLVLNLIKRTNARDLEELETPLQRLIALHKGLDDELSIQEYLRFIDAENSRWGLTDRADYGRIAALASADYPREQLRSIFVRFYNAYMVLKTRAQAAFDQELARMEKPETEEFRIVQPHISLFIAFLRLFRHAQDSLNELVGKQLDLYYEKVLALNPAPAEPDHVFLIFTLAKNFGPQFLAKGTQLLGGKDKNGVPIYYETTEDWTVGQAKLKEVKSFYLPSSIFSFYSELNAQDTESHKTLLGTDYKLPLDKNGVRIFSDQKKAEEMEIGFVIASPQLMLQEGRRLIQIQITKITKELTKKLIAVQLSGKEGWIKEPILPADLSTIKFEDPGNAANPYPALPSDQIEPVFDLTGPGTDPRTVTLKIFLPKDYPAVVPMEKSQMTQWPAVKVTLKKDQLPQINLENYENIVSNAADKHFSVSVRADGVSKNLILQTDQGVFNGTQQVMPFGPTTPRGARFYVGFAEALLKKLDNISLKINWVEPFTSRTGAGSLTDYYDQYDLTPSGAVQLGILNNNIFETEGTRELLFTNNDPAEHIVLPTGAGGTTLQERDSDPVFELLQYDPSVRRGFLRLTFTGDLYHKEYAEKLALRSISESGENASTASTQKLDQITTLLAENAADTIDKDLISGIITAQPTTGLPKPPYTPVFNSIECDYVSKDQTMESLVDEFYYLHPFDGFERAEKIAKNSSDEEDPTYSFAPVTLFKNFLIKEKPEEQARGYLYLGFEGLKPGNSLSLLVQTIEGSEQRVDVDPPRIQWSYLTSGNCWEMLSLDRIMDSTGGLTRSGILQFSVPQEISSEGNTLLNPELLWLRAQSWEVQDPKKLAAALPRMAYLHAQVIKAQFLDKQLNEYSHLSEDQASGTIEKLAISRSAIKKIEQPFPTFGGRLPESEGQAFYTRISERLRHRDRAVTVWDYEHLLLQAFPNIAAVKCIPHSKYLQIPSSELAPGNVTVAVIPSLQARSGFSLKQPRFPKGDLDEMRDYLLTKSNGFLGQLSADGPSLFVTNGQYELLQIEMYVVFKRGLDQDFFSIQLNNDIRRFLSPWLFGGAAPGFGLSLRRSRLIQFVEELHYIEYVRVEQQVGGVTRHPKIYKVGQVQDVIGEYIMPDAAHGILASAESHRIKIYNP